MKIVKEISGISGNEVFFGNIYKGNDTLVNVYIKNNGNAPVSFDSIFVDAGSGSNAGEFVLQKLGLPKSVNVFQSVFARVRFIPDTSKSVLGLRTAKLVILSDADSPRLEILLKGNAVESPLTVPEVIESDGYRFTAIAPNPAVNETELYFELPESDFVLFRIIGSTGRTIETIPANSFDAGLNRVRLNTANYSSGIYYCIMQAGTRLLYRKFVINK
jgi:hypothetical protein